MLGRLGGAAAPRGRARATAAYRPRRVDRRCGQVLPIMAIMGTLLVGATALGVDLSLQTHYRRTLQNVSDSAALAGAREITWTATQSGPSGTTQSLAVQRALEDIRTSMTDLTGGPNRVQGPWAALPAAWPTTFPISSATTPGAESCLTGAVPSPTPSGVYVSGNVDVWTVTVNTPPVCSVTHNWDVRDVEVIIRQVSQTGFARVVGFQSSGESGHAVAQHQPFGLPFGFALYVRTYITGGNSAEVFDGSIYAGRNVNPQASSGGTTQSFICTDRISPSQGSAVYVGAPQWPANTTTSQYAVSPNGNPPDVLQQVTSCPNAVGGYANQTQLFNTCSQSVPGVSFTGYWDGSYSKACVFQPALALPNLPGPSVPWTTLSANGQNKPALAITDGGAVAPGVYEIVHNPQCSVKSCFDVTIDGTKITSSGCAPVYAPFYTLCLAGVTFVLDPGATVGVIKGATVLDAPPFYPGYPGTPSGNATAYDGVYPFWSQLQGDNDNGSGIWVLNQGSSLSTIGTVYVPNGSVNTDANGKVFLQGQAIADSWNVQSGSLQQPVISYTGQRLAPQPETLRLVE